MQQFWLVKTEPTTYSFADLQKAGHATWDGVANATALIHLRAMAKGDRVLIYHTGAERQIVGTAEVTRGAYPDPKAGDPKLVVVDLKPVGLLPKPVTLATIKADSIFADFALVRIGRLSVMPVTPAQWKRLVAMGR